MRANPTHRRIRRQTDQTSVCLRIRRCFDIKNWNKKYHREIPLNLNRLSAKRLFSNAETAGELRVKRFFSCNALHRNRPQRGGRHNKKGRNKKTPTPIEQHEPRTRCANNCSQKTKDAKRTKMQKIN